MFFGTKPFLPIERIFDLLSFTPLWSPLRSLNINTYSHEIYGEQVLEQRGINYVVSMIKDFRVL